MPAPRRRIAFVLPVYWPAVGGCELHTRELAQRIAQRHEVRIITLINSEEDKHAHELWLAAILRAPRKTSITWDGAISITRLGMRWMQAAYCAPLARIQSPKLPDRLVEAAMEQLAGHYRARLEEELSGMDIVHSVHGGVSFLGYAALQAARRLGLPFVYTPLMHLQPGRAGTPGAGGAPVLSLRLVPRTWTDAYWRKIWQQADALLAMTDYEREYYIGEGFPAARAYRTGVGPMVEASAAEPCDAPGAQQDQAPMVLFLGRNTLAKGVSDVLHAAPLVWKAFPRAKFIFAGPRAPETDVLYGEARDPRIQVLGEVSGEQKDELLRRCWILCVPSREESLGAIFLEAWAHGKPVIGLRIPPLEELTEGEQGGLLAEPTPRDVADKLVTLMSNPELRRRTGEWGWRRVHERYSWGAIAARTEAIYETLLSGAHRSPPIPLGIAR
jgi:glycosyltransferase involved in cell wall biosynthesis